jgi:hypothetical protein
MLRRDADPHLLSANGTDLSAVIRGATHCARIARSARGASCRAELGRDSSLCLNDLDQDHRFFVQTTISDPVERLGWGEEKDQDPSDVARLRGGPADGHDPALVDRGHFGQIERDRSPGSEAGDRLEQQISVLGQHRTDDSQRAGGQEFELHLAIVGRSATQAKPESRDR